MTFKGHIFGIKTFFEEGNVTNGVLESLNSKVQLAKRRARGYSNVSNFMDMVYYPYFRNSIKSEKFKVPE